MIALGVVVRVSTFLFLPFDLNYSGAKAQIVNNYIRVWRGL